MRQPGRCDGHNGDALLIDDERVLVGAVRRSAILDDTQAAGRQLILHAIIEKDHTIGDIFLETVTSEHTVATLAGDDRSDPFLLQPLNKPNLIAARHGCRTRRTAFDGVDHDPLGAD